MWKFFPQSCLAKTQIVSVWNRQCSLKNQFELLVLRVCIINVILSFLPFPIFQNLNHISISLSNHCSFILSPAKIRHLYL